MADNEVTEIREDHSKNLWIGTSRGLSRMCLRTERIRNYFNVDGLSSASILSLLVDSSGKVWVGTRSGLCCYIPEQDNFKGWNL